MILYAIALADDDQEQQSEDSFKRVTVREGLERLALYLSSVSRFPNALGAFLYPLYGQGELAQAFCRSAAVKGALYVLRRSVDAILMEKDKSQYKGIRTGSGQILYSQKLVIGPCLLSLENFSNLMSFQQGLEASGHGFHTCRTTESSSSPVCSGSRCWKVARFVCITDSSLQPDQHNILMVFPPRSLSGTFSSVVRALQLSSNTSVCPEGRFVVQFSTLCLHSKEAKEAIQSIVEALFWTENSAGDVTSKELGKNTSNLVQKPKILWSSFYVQPLSVDEELQGAHNGVGFCTLPSQALDYQSIMRSTEKILTTMTRWSLTRRIVWLAWRMLIQLIAWTTVQLVRERSQWLLEGFRYHKGNKSHQLLPLVATFSGNDHAVLGFAHARSNSVIVDDFWWLEFLKLLRQ
ncbi:hypothetical protein O6H91_Y202300 [Diphasiastrum complanatum]|nr:hypothetical protein O6H91_Y202300 [Diphasiastrum complanatum]